MSRLAVIFLAAIAVIRAQSNTASISGTVTDTQGASVPNATVTVSNRATDVRTVSRTNDSGFYSIPNLQTGQYTVTIEHQGFRRYERKDLLLTTGQSLELSVKLELGAVAETVTVTGDAPLLETRTSDVSQLIESKSIESLPLGNRRTLNVVALTELTGLFLQ